MLFKLQVLAVLFLTLFIAQGSATAIPRSWKSRESRLRRSEDLSRLDYWQAQLRKNLNTLQRQYFDDSHWPSTNHWISAFLGTLVASSSISLTTSLGEYRGLTLDTDEGVKHEIYAHFHDVESHYQVQPEDIKDEAYDDVQWVVLEWLEAIKLVTEWNTHLGSTIGYGSLSKFGRRAHEYYNIVHDKFDDSLCGGGLTWDPDLATYKNAITNELFVTSSISMYFYFPGDNAEDPYLGGENSRKRGISALVPHDPKFLDNAIKAYEWFKTENFHNNQGLVVDGFHISSGQDTCDQRNNMVYTYNQGVLLSGLRGLWDATGDMKYLDDAHALIGTVVAATGWSNDGTNSQWSGLGRRGILEESCDAHGDCNPDARMFKGIYFDHLSRFCEPLPKTNPLIPGLTQIATDDLSLEHRNICNSYLPWIEHNAEAALSTQGSDELIRGWWAANGKVKRHSDAGFPIVEDTNLGVDYRNKPWLLEDPFWAGDSAVDCNSTTLGVKARRGTKDIARPTWDIWGQDSSGPTVEAHASGVGVIKTAFDFNLWKTVE